MAGGVTMTLGAIAAVAGILVLRLSWGRAQRSAVLNTLGWGLLAASVATGWAFAGAWGVTVASLWAIGAALVVLSIAAWGDTAKGARGSNRRAGMLPEKGEPRRIARRITTFAIVIVGGVAAAIALGITMRGTAVLARANEADANVIAFFAVPLAWSILAVVLLLLQDRKHQLMVIAAPIVTSVPALAFGTMS